MSATSTVNCENRLLGALPRDLRNRFLSKCERVEVDTGNRLVERGGRIIHAYFPTNCQISLIGSIQFRASLEVSQVGNEGMCGIPLALGINISPVDCIVRQGGSALRISAKLFRRELTQYSVFQRLVNRYIYVLMKQLALLVVCNRFHVVEARPARCLLVMSDHLGTDKLRITHDMLAQILGVRRVGITKAAGSLQKRRLMTYSRGNITVTNRNGLEGASCPCYRADKTTYDRIMS